MFPHIVLSEIEIENKETFEKNGKSLFQGAEKHQLIIESANWTICSAFAAAIRACSWVKTVAGMSGLS